MRLRWRWRCTRDQGSGEKGLAAHLARHVAVIWVAIQADDTEIATDGSPLISVSLLLPATWACFNKNKTLLKWQSRAEPARRAFRAEEGPEKDWGLIKKMCNYGCTANNQELTRNSSSSRDLCSVWIPQPFEILHSMEARDLPAASTMAPYCGRGRTSAACSAEGTISLQLTMLPFLSKNNKILNVQPRKAYSSIL